MQHLHDLTTCCAVGTEPAGKERCMRTASPCLMRRHGRPYAENACLVGRGGDYSALAETAYNDGFSP